MIIKNNYSDKETEKLFIVTKADIKSIYKKAAKEANKTALEYFEKLPERYRKEYQAYLDGKYTKTQFLAWFNSQIGRGKRWKTIRNNIADIAVNANKKAADVINKASASVFALNSNYTAYEIEKGTGIAFNIVDQRTVNELLKKKNHSEFRTINPDLVRDYKWNYERIQNALTSGILQGKSIEHLADSFMEVMENNRKAAVRNCRTAVTSAQSAGRQERYKEAEARGIKIVKEWISANDDRVRDSHAELNGVRVGIDEEFPNGLMYPGDPSGYPAEVYNCRCSMRAVLLGYDNENANVTGNDRQTYKEWAMSKGYNPDRKVY